ncbi:hypothetical protein VTN96DRAFT_3471 [Rasamsonia emersonii]
MGAPRHGQSWRAERKHRGQNGQKAALGRQASRSTRRSWAREGVAGSPGDGEGDFLTAAGKRVGVDDVFGVRGTCLRQPGSQQQSSHRSLRPQSDLMPATSQPGSWMQ